MNIIDYELTIEEKEIFINYFVKEGRNCKQEFIGWRNKFLLSNNIIKDIKEINSIDFFKRNEFQINLFTKINDKQLIWFDIIGLKDFNFSNEKVKNIRFFRSNLNIKNNFGESFLSIASKNRSFDYELAKIVVGNKDNILHDLLLVDKKCFLEFFNSWNLNGLPKPRTTNEEAKKINIKIKIDLVIIPILHELLENVCFKELSKEDKVNILNKILSVNEYCIEMINSSNSLMLPIISPTKHRSLVAVVESFEETKNELKNLLDFMLLDLSLIDNNMKIRKTIKV